MTRKTSTKAAPAPASERRDGPLTPEDRLTAFKTATRGFAKHYASEIATGMSDIELESALSRTLGIMGGSCGPGALDVSFQGAGLRIWASWNILNQNNTQPIFAGRTTIATAREVYGIANPHERQLSLF